MRLRKGHFRKQCFLPTSDIKVHQIEEETEKEKEMLPHLPILTHLVIFGFETNASCWERKSKRPLISCGERRTRLKHEGWGAHRRGAAARREALHARIGVCLTQAGNGVGGWLERKKGMILLEEKSTGRYSKKVGWPEKKEVLKKVGCLAEK